jgi:hypothetical protein
MTRKRQISNKHAGFEALGKKYIIFNPCAFVPLKQDKINK